jgi:hypothetical protein
MTHDFRGRLSSPGTTGHHDSQRRRQSCDPLFAHGYGLSFAAPATVPTLEVSDSVSALAPAGLLRQRPTHDGYGAGRMMINRWRSTGSAVCGRPVADDQRPTAPRGRCLPLRWLPASPATWSSPERAAARPRARVERQLSLSLCCVQARRPKAVVRRRRHRPRGSGHHADSFRRAMAAVPRCPALPGRARPTCAPSAPLYFTGRTRLRSAWLMFASRPPPKTCTSAQGIPSPDWTRTSRRRCSRAILGFRRTRGPVSRGRVGLAPHSSLRCRVRAWPGPIGC